MWHLSVQTPHKVLRQIDNKTTKLSAAGPKVTTLDIPHVILIFHCHSHAFSTLKNVADYPLHTDAATAMRMFIQCPAGLARPKTRGRRAGSAWRWDCRLKQCQGLPQWHSAIGPANPQAARHSGAHSQHSLWPLALPTVTLASKYSGWSYRETGTLWLGLGTTLAHMYTWQFHLYYQLIFTVFQATVELIVWL